MFSEWRNKTWLRIKSLWKRSQLRHDLEDEVAFHLAMREEKNRREGIAPEEARYAAHRQFGNTTSLKERSRGMWTFALAENILRDIRFTARMLLKNPGFTIVAVLTLALGIGANTAIFTLINAVMFRPLPVRDPQKLIQIVRVVDGQDQPLSFPLFEFLAGQMHSIDGAFARGSADVFVNIDGVAQEVSADLVSGGYFPLLGLKPATGRLLEPADDAVQDNAAVAVISFDFWHSRFAEAPEVVGKTLFLGGRLFTIVGVAPQGFTGVVRGRNPDVTFPMSMAPIVWAVGSSWKQEDDHNSLNMFARLHPGMTLRTASTDLQVLFDAFLRLQASRAHNDEDRHKVWLQRAKVSLAPTGKNPLRSQYSETLFILMGAVALIMLLACANLAGLLSARSSKRLRETSIRRALGASRFRLSQQFLVESGVLAALGGGAGVVLAQWLTRALLRMMANGTVLSLPVQLDLRVLLFTVAVSLATCVLMGSAPAFRAVRADVNAILKETHVGGHRQWGNVLLVSQIAISMTLLVGASLFTRTVLNLYALDSGFQRHGVLTLGVRAGNDYPNARAIEIEQMLVGRFAELPGVISASAVQVLPVSGQFWDRPAQVEGYSSSSGGDSVAYNVVAPKYFETIGTALLAGRDFTSADTVDSPKVVVVNESFAKRYFPGRSPLGLHVKYVNLTTQIVGVVGNAQYQDLRSGVVPTMYVPWTQRVGSYQPTMYTYLLRVAPGNPLRLTAAAGQMIRDADSGLGMTRPQTYTDVVDRSINRERIVGALSSCFGMLATLLAGLGVFGVMAFRVSRRTNEFGVRIALGATCGNILRPLLRETGVVFIIGAGIGSVAALALARLSSSMLFGLNAVDPVSFALALLVLATSTFAAGYFPARRASRVDPVSALRHD